jgi:hypothetical protein
MATLATLLVAIVLLLLAAAIGFSYLGGATQLLRRSGALRVVRFAVRAVGSIVKFAFTLVVPRRPRRARTLPAARAYRRPQGAKRHDRAF